MIHYWPYTNTNSATTAGSYWNGNTTSTATNSTWHSATGNTLQVYYTWIVKHYLIIEPECWTEQNAADFTRLVNDETATGFKVQFRIKGDVQIADPEIEIRTMANFVPLLLSKANLQDKQKISDFFSAHPCEAGQA